MEVWWDSKLQLYEKFTAKYGGERIQTIGWQSGKLWGKTVAAFTRYKCLKDHVYERKASQTYSLPGITM